MEDPYVVVFAGVPGTSKTPIAHFLSCEFNLPILNTDQIRYEVKEDFRVDDINEPHALAEFEKRRDERGNRLLASKKSFIMDGSMDRRWKEVKERLVSYGYDWLMINMELTKPFLIKLFEQTGRSEWAENHLDDYLKQHEDFLAKYAADVDVKIDDDKFANRLQLAASELNKFLNRSA